MDEKMAGTPWERAVAECRRLLDERIQEMVRRHEKFAGFTLEKERSKDKVRTTFEALLALMKAR